MTGRKPGPALYGGAAILLLIIALAAWAALAPLHDPLLTVGPSLGDPSATNPLGTDNLGRDSFTRLALAGGSSLLISGAAALLAAVLGTIIGIVAGYLGGLVDAVVMRLVDALLSIPAILMALIVGVVLGKGVLPLVLALGVVFAPAFARVMRAPVLALRDRDFVVAARISGVRTWRIAGSHLLPNVLTPLLVQFAAVASNVVLLEAALSYLGQGVQAPDPSAGRMISEFTRFMQTQPLLIIAPALLIVLLSAGWNLLADGVQNLLAPRRDRTLPGRRSPRVTRLSPEPVTPTTEPEPVTRESRS